MRLKPNCPQLLPPSTSIFFQLISSRTFSSSLAIYHRPKPNCPQFLPPSTSFFFFSSPQINQLCGDQMAPSLNSQLNLPYSLSAIRLKPDVTDYYLWKNTLSPNLKSYKLLGRRIYSSSSYHRRKTGNQGSSLTQSRLWTLGSIWPVLLLDNPCCCLSWNQPPIVRCPIRIGGLGKVEKSVWLTSMCLATTWFAVAWCQ